MGLDLATLFQGAMKYGMPIITGVSQRNAQKKADRDNQAMYSGWSRGFLGTPYDPNATIADTAEQIGNAIASGNYGGMTGRLLNRFDRGTDLLRNAYKNIYEGPWGILNRMDKVSSKQVTRASSDRGYLLDQLSDINQRNLYGMQNRMNRGMAMLEGMGEQEKADINQTFDSNRAAINQDMVSRGLGGSTVAATLKTGNERERTGAQGRLQDRLRRQKFGAFSALSGDVERTRQTGSANYFNTSASTLQNKRNLQNSWEANRLNAYGNYMNTLLNQARNDFAQRQNMETSFGNQALNFLTSPYVSYPNEGSYMQLLNNYGFGSIDPWRPKRSGLFGLGGNSGAGGSLATSALMLGDLALGGGLTVPGVMGNMIAGQAIGSFL